MKKVLYVAVLVAATLSTMIPAHAAILHKEACNTYYSPNGTRAVKVCASVLESTDAQPNFWGRIQFLSVAGKADPYSATGVWTLFWNKSRYVGAGWCDGNAPACNSTGDGLNESHVGFPATFTSNMLSPSHHYDLTHTEAIFTINWTNGGAQTGGDFNSGAGDYATEPYCLAYNSQDQTYCSF